MSAAVFTIIAKNYLAHARVLMSSLRQANPELDRYVVLTDRIDDYFEPAQEDFELIRSEELGIPNSPWFHFKYSLIELGTAVKPFAFQYLFDRKIYSKVLFFDPDIYVYSPLTHLSELLDKHQIILTPHLTSALNDSLRPSELDILRTGTYNLGFIGLTNGSEALRMVDWWRTRLYDNCVVDLPRGLFVDQRWIDLVPGLFSGVCVVRNSAYNVAYWNLNDRHIQRTGEYWTIHDERLCFFHFSGFDPRRPDELSRFQNRYTTADLKEVRTILREYAGRLLDSGYATCIGWPYAFGRFENGITIPDPIRPAHVEGLQLPQVENPFSVASFETLRKLWNEPVDDSHAAPSVTRLAYRIYRSRQDAQAAFPDILGRDRRHFIRWLLSSSDRSDPLHEGFQAVPGEMAVNWVDASPVNGQPRVQLTAVARSIYAARPDIQRFFPDPQGRHAAGFLIWLLTFGRETYNLHEFCLEPLRAELERLLSYYSVVQSMRCRAVYRIAKTMLGAQRLLGRMRMKVGSAS